MIKRFIKFFYNHQKTKTILHRILIKLKIPEKIGFLATGESHKNNINPLFITCDATDSDIHLIFNDKFSFPFQDNKLRLIYSSHNLEHLNEKTSDRYFEEVYRVLKKGGELSIEVPNAELIYSNYSNYLKTGSSLELQELIDFTFPEEVKRNVVSNQSLSTEDASKQLNEIHNKVLSFLSCYCVPAYVGAHTPVVVDEQVFNENFKKLTMAEFFIWCIDLMDEKQKLSGGHINPWFPRKLIDRLEMFGFDAKIRSFRDSRIFSRSLSRFVIPDREHRTFYSFRISAIKR
tara:strand:+ start:3299 stop:4165 length:867 start_codon:yes stop_codon:yes gene_type:complete